MGHNFGDDEAEDSPMSDDNDDFVLHLLEGDDCGMNQQGYCGKAGSEECEFGCPYRGARRVEEKR